MATQCEGDTERQVRVGALVSEHFAYIWRLLRRVGLAESDADDAAQQVFVTAARRFESIESGSERAFLYRTALHTAYKLKRSAERRHEHPADESELPPVDPGIEELLDRRRARDMLDGLLEAMPLDLRVVFVLYEIEGLSTSEIAGVVGIPLGTAASRLRRARQDFETRVARLEARRNFRGNKS
jgi:RNA polymerase sigma-70 factor (ECF subfamily)